MWVLGMIAIITIIAGFYGLFYNFKDAKYLTGQAKVEHNFYCKIGLGLFFIGVPIAATILETMGRS